MLQGADGGNAFIREAHESLKLALDKAPTDEELLRVVKMMSDEVAVTMDQRDRKLVNDAYFHGFCLAGEAFFMLSRRKPRLTSAERLDEFREALKDRLESDDLPRHAWNLFGAPGVRELLHEVPTTTGLGRHAEIRRAAITGKY